jgi:hypothetical protein
MEFYGHYRVQKILTLASVLSQMSPVHTHTTIYDRSEY